MTDDAGPRVTRGASPRATDEAGPHVTADAGPRVTGDPLRSAAPGPADHPAHSPATDHGGRTARRTPLSAPGRLLAVLAAFDHEHPALCLTDISRRAGLTLTTAHRLVGALTEWGALERDEDGAYHVGLRLWEVAALAPRGLALRQAALPYLEDLYEATHENVQMAVRDGAEVVYIEWLSGRSAVGVRIQVGARWPLHATGVGLALLAHGDPAFQEAYCRGPLVAFTPHTISDGVRLRRELAEVRRTGVAVSSRQVTDDAVSVAAPVRRSGGAVVAAVSVVVPWHDGRVPALVPAVRLAARGISRALGWQPLPDPPARTGARAAVPPRPDPDA